MKLNMKVKWIQCCYHFILLYVCSIAVQIPPLPRVTINEHSAEFPAASVTVHVTVCVPSSKSDIDGGLQEYVGELSTVSCTFGSGYVIGLLDDVTSDGHVIVGGVRSNGINKFTF